MSTSITTSIDLQVREYSLLLKSNQRVTIAECDLSLLSDELVRTLLSPTWVFSRISRVPRDFVEEAKIGYHDNFLKHFHSDPESLIAKLSGSTCSYTRSCSNYNDKCHIPKISMKWPIIQNCFSFGDELEMRVMNEILYHVSQKHHFILVTS